MSDTLKEKERWFENMDEILQIAICEDTQSEQERLLSLLHQASIQNQAIHYESGEQLLSEYMVGKFDLLLMDIYMSGMTGLETSKKIREIDRDIPLAFVTASTEHTLESYRLNALKYIEKPYNTEDINEMLELALMKKQSASGLVIQKNKIKSKIPFSKILYLEQKNRQVLIALYSRELICVYDKLSDLLPQLDGELFFHCHKSYAVHLPFISGIDKDLRCFVLIDGKNIPIRRELMGKAKKELERYLSERTRGLTS